MTSDDGQQEQQQKHHHPKSFNDILVRKANRDKALSTTSKAPLKLPAPALAEAAKHDKQDFVSAEQYERRNRAGATSAAVASFKDPISAMAEDEQDDQGLVLSASYYEKKSKQAALSAATTSFSNLDIADGYTSGAHNHPDGTTRSGALTGAVKADSQPSKTKLGKQRSETPSFDAGFLYDRARTLAHMDFYNANPSLAWQVVADEKADRKNRASQAGRHAMATNPAEYTARDGGFEDDMVKMQGIDVHSMAEQNAKNIMESMNDGDVAFRNYYLSQLLEMGQPKSSGKKEGGGYLGTGTMRSDLRVEDNVSTQPTRDSGWEEMSEKDRKKAMKAVAKQNKREEAEAKKAKKSAKKKGKESPEQGESEQSHWEEQKSKTRRGLSLWKKRRNPEKWPDWEGSLPVEDEAPRFEDSDADDLDIENELEEHARARSRDEAEDSGTHSPSPKESRPRGRLLRSVTSLVGLNKSNEEKPQNNVTVPDGSASLDRRLGDNDLDKQVEDRESLLERAQRNSQATISQIDQAIMDKSGKAPITTASTQSSSWAEEEPPEPEGVKW